MKKTKFILGMVAGVAAILAVGAFASCQLELDNAEDRASVSGYAPKSLAITGQTVSFVKGSDFSLGENAVVTVTYANSTEEVPNKANVTDKVTVTKPDLTTLGDGKKVTVSYTEAGVTVSCEYTVNVTNALDSIAIKTAPTNTNLVTYGTPNLAGLVITLTYSDKTTKDVTYSSETAKDFSVAPVTTAGDSVDVTVTYSGKTATYKANVKTVAAAAAAYALDGNDTGVSIVGAGSYVDDATFTKVFKNDGSAQRTSYLLLPSDTLQHSAESKEMTIGFWVNTNADLGWWYPMFAAYGAAPVNNKNTFPMFMLQSRCLAQVNCAGYCDFGAELWTSHTDDWEKDAESNYVLNSGYQAWKNSSEWHYYTCVITATTLEIFLDGTSVSKWTVDGTTAGQVISGMFTSNELTYVCLGGNQAWDWGDNDTPYSYAKFSVWDVALNAEQIASVVAAK